MTNLSNNDTSDENDLPELIEAYRALPTDQLVAESILLTCDPVAGPRLAGAAVLGFTRAGQYVDTARGLIDQIVLNAEQMSWHMEAYSVIRDGMGTDYDGSPLAQREVARAAYHHRGAVALSVRSEVHWHLYAACLDRSWHFMLNSAKHFDPSFALKPVQEHYIETIRAFRNHLEHRDKAVWDSNSEDWASMSRSGEDWFEIGYRRDNRNRILFTPLTGRFQGTTLKMPMSQDGFLEFKNINVYTYERLQHSTLDRPRRRFI
jgi:hypothetical protein